MLSAKLLTIRGGIAELNLTAPAITPTLGSELVVNGSMESGSPPSGWISGGTTRSAVADERTGGAGVQSMQVTRGSGQTAVNYSYQGVSLMPGRWYKLDYWMRNVDASVGARIVITNARLSHSYLAATSWTNRTTTGRALLEPNFMRLFYSTDAEGQSVRYDDVSLKELTFGSLFVELGDIKRQTGVWTARPTIVDQTQCGIAINYDDGNNFVLAYVARNDDGSDTAYLEKCIAGTWTTVISGTVDYGAGKELKIGVEGTDYSLFYDGFQVGTATEISDSGLGTEVYGFSTDSESEVRQVTTTPFFNVTLATLSNVTQTETTIRPIDAMDGRLYGTDVAMGNELYESEDYGDTWTQIADLGVGSAINGLRKLADGEVLVMRRASGVFKSSGWSVDRTTATFSQVLAPNTGAWMLPWGLDVSGSVVLATEYANPREPSRYVYVSKDNGDTFTTVLDLDVLYPGESAAVHWHSVCIDPWANNRLWAAHGDGIHGIYYSDDLGDTWTLLTDEWQPTVMAATPYGIVTGTDMLEEGLMRILRTDNPADMRIEGMFQMGYSGWYGFAQRAWRDPDTNLVYVCWQVDTAGLPAHILVSNGRDGHNLYEVPISGPTATPNLVQIMTIGSKLIADLSDAGTRYLVRGDLS